MVIRHWQGLSPPNLYNCVTNQKIALEPSDANGYIIKGLIYIQMNDLQSAEKVYKTGIGICSDVEQLKVYK